MREILKKIIPAKIRYYRSAIRAYIYDINRYIKYSNTYYLLDNENKIKGLLTMTYHVLEKGLTMPETRLGFGYERVQKLIDLCNIYINKKYDSDSIEFKHSIKILNEYLLFHEERQYTINDHIKKQIVELKNNTGIHETSKQIETSKEEFTKMCKSNFKEFCKSRHTVRNYTEEEIPIEILYDCIKMAQTSPSACNRQPNRVYIIKDKDIISKVLNLQNGNRGFGHLANTVIIFTSDISVFQSIGERKEAWLNSGMFSMQFINALHYYGIGSCALNWSFGYISADKLLRQIININEYEEITLLLSCGNIPSNLKLTESPRSSIDKVVNIVKL